MKPSTLANHYNRRNDDTQVSLTDDGDDEDAYDDYHGDAGHGEDDEKDENSRGLLWTLDDDTYV